MAQYADQEELLALISDPAKKPGRDYLVVDVRGDDYAGGHIPGARNVPSNVLLENPDQQLQELGGVPVLFFHCALSQVRGPKCANRYAEALARAGRSGTQQVKVLRGGFEQWQARFRGDPKLVEDWDAEMWDVPFA
ncbi:Cdc25 phosphatase Ibp1 [Polyrhizophydium stewartii]|uniref:Cdc25 phosphatase Ibp1 n=1 Tax=Polyrhizophydium stewartii TaxID=2732419 RepID=A0ABR4NI71_9FUNG|nr:hypothetical protein HK105_001009 [Polyrhizophydium stewartii]